MPDIEVERIEVKKIEGREGVLFLLGAVMTILVLVWGKPPSSGVFTSTILLILAFTCFLNSYSLYLRANLIVEEKQLQNGIFGNLNRIIEVLGNLQTIGFSFTITVLSILGYKYLMDLPNSKFLSLLIPIVFMCSKHIFSVIIPRLIKRHKKYSGRLYELIIELVFLLLIILDFMGIIVIP